MSDRSIGEPQQREMSAASSELLHEDALRLVIDTIPGLVWSARADGYIDYLNKRWIEYTGLTLEQASGWGWQVAIHPEDLPGLLEYWMGVLSRGAGGEYEARLRQFDGSYRWFLFRGVPLHNAAGELVKWYGTNTDIEDRKWAEALLAGERQVLEMIASGAALTPVITRLCELVEAAAPGCLCAIVLVDASGTRLQHGAAPSLPVPYSAAIHGRPVNLESGPCAMAACTTRQVIAVDAALDTRWDAYAWGELATAHGLRACWSTPILSSAQQSLGVFAIYWREPASPMAQHRWIINQVTHLAAVAIERSQAEDQLRRSEYLLAQGQRLSATGSFIWDAVGKRLTLSDEARRICEIEPGQAVTGEQIRELIHPDDLPLFRQMLAGSSGAFRFECRLLLPSGTLKYLQITADAVHDDADQLVEWMGAVMDITERRRAQDALNAAKVRFEGILAIADDAIISVGADQRITLFNQGAEKVFGYRAEEVIGHALDLLLPQRFGAAHRQHLEAFQGATDHARSMGLRREVLGLRKDGSEFAAEASISRLDLGCEVVFTVILRDITARQQVAEALRASEQLARGQVEALTHTLDALASESVPDRIVEHVLRTLTYQLDAHSCSLWRRNEGSDLVAFEYSYEHAILMSRADADTVAVGPALKVDDVWPWPVVFRTGKPYLLEDIREGPDFPWRKHVLSLGVVTILIMPMSMAGQVDGVIGIRFTQKRSFRPEEMALAQALANQAMLALQWTRLSQQSRQSAVMAERNRLARDIHDTLAQGFTGVIVQLEASGDARARGLADEADAHLRQAGELARESLKEARRSVQALRPLALEDKDLGTALREMLRKMTQGTALRAEFHMQGKPRTLLPEWEENLLRIGQEVLTNALRHASASHLTVSLAFLADALQLSLRDNGVGFELRHRHDGFGLVGMRERVESMGGTICITSAPGAGTQILIVLPDAGEACRPERTL